MSTYSSTHSFEVSLCFDLPSNRFIDSERDHITLPEQLSWHVPAWCAIDFGSWDFSLELEVAIDGELPSWSDRIDNNAPAWERRSITCVELVCASSQSTHRIELPCELLSQIAVTYDDFIDDATL